MKSGPAGPAVPFSDIPRLERVNAEYASRILSPYDSGKYSRHIKELKSPYSIVKCSGRLFSIPRTGKEIPKDQRKERLGSGHSGSVRIARDAFTGQLYAYKKIKADSMIQLTHFTNDAQREVELLQRAGQFASFYAEADEDVYKFHVGIIMEYKGHQNMGNYVTIDGSDSTPKDSYLARPSLERLKEIYTVILSLHCIHKKGVILNDIKLSNIVTNGIHAHMIDFGLGCPVAVEDDDDAFLAQNLQGNAGATPPEIWKSLSKNRVLKYSRKTDIYSLALAILELFGQTVIGTCYRNRTYRAVENTDIMLDNNEQIAVAHFRKMAADEPSERPTLLETLTFMEETFGFKASEYLQAQEKLATQNNVSNPPKRSRDTRRSIKPLQQEESVKKRKTTTRDEIRESIDVVRDSLRESFSMFESPMASPLMQISESPRYSR